MQADIILLRHGQTEYNRLGLLMGRTDRPLNGVGRSQAEQAIYKISSIGISKIYSSPLMRCLETAEIIGDALNIPYIILDELAERDWGDYEGMPISKRTNLLNPPNGEKQSHFEKRLKRIFTLVRGSGSKLIITHSGVIKTLIQWDAIFSKIPHCEPIPYHPNKAAV